MKYETLKLAGMVTMMCGGFAWHSAQAEALYLPKTVVGRVLPLEGGPRDRFDGAANDPLDGSSDGNAMAAASDDAAEAERGSASVPDVAQDGGAAPAATVGAIGGGAVVVPGGEASGGTPLAAMAATDDVPVVSDAGSKIDASMRADDSAPPVRIAPIAVPAVDWTPARVDVAVPVNAAVEVATEAAPVIDVPRAAKAAALASMPADLAPSSTKAVPVADITLQKNAAPLVDLAPSTKTEPVVDIAPQKNAAPLVDLTPAIRPAPLVKITPTIKAIPLVEVAPAIRTAPLAEPAPAPAPAQRPTVSWTDARPAVVAAPVAEPAPAWKLASLWADTRPSSKPATSTPATLDAGATSSTRGAGDKLASAPAAAAPLSQAAPLVAPQPESRPVAQKAEGGKEDPAWASEKMAAVSEDKLDKMRGGFDLPSGLKVSFGILRSSYVNGNLVATTSFNIPDVGNITTQQAQMLASTNMGGLIQNGPGNTVQPGALPALSGAVIQNTLNNQNIQAITQINTTVNSLAAFKGLNIQSTLNNAFNSAARPR